MVTAPAPLIEATLKENAWAEPMCGVPSRLKRMRSIAPVSVAVPTVERGSAPIRCWSTMIAVVSPSSTSTSGRDSVGMKPCRKALYVSLISRCESAAIVWKTSELLPEPETPVKTVSRRFGISTWTSLRLFSRAPCTRIRSWLSATCGAVSVREALLNSAPSSGGPAGRPRCVPIAPDSRRGALTGASRILTGRRWDVPDCLMWDGRISTTSSGCGGPATGWTATTPGRSTYRRSRGRP